MKNKCLLVFLFFSFNIFAAGPIFHLYVAEKFCEICEISDKDVLKDIIIGSEFPDIRYITHDSRDLTHPPVYHIEEVYLSKTPFEAGYRLHIWLDNVREAFISKDIYDEVNPYADGFSATLLKFIEEEIISDFYDGRKWFSCFDLVLPEELNFTKEENILKWHKMIQWTISFRPFNLLWIQSYRGSMFGISVDTLYNWSFLLPEFKKKDIFKKHVHDLLTYIESELKNSFFKNSFLN